MMLPVIEGVVGGHGAVCLMSASHKQDRLSNNSPSSWKSARVHDADAMVKVSS